MAITVRKGLSSALVKSKLLPGELAVTTDTGELYFCHSAGNVRKAATAEDVQAMFDAAPEAYEALQQLLADLELNPSELTNILNNIAALQTGKLDKTGDTLTNTLSFTESAILENIATGERHDTIAGKIKKYLSFIGNTALTTIAQTISGAINELNAKKVAKGELCINVKDNGLVGNNSTDDYSALNTLITSIGSAKTDLFFTSGTYKIGTNVTIPSNIRCIFANGAMLSPNSGITISIHGEISAGLYQVFGGSGNYSIAKIKNRVGYPEWFGAIVNNSSIDCLPAFNKCIDNFPITQLQLADYYISDTLIVNKHRKKIYGVDSYDLNDTDKQATRIIIMSGTKDVMFVGLTSKPAEYVDFITNIKIRDLELGRSVTVTPPAIGNEINSASGLRLRYTLLATIKNVRTTENTIGFVLDGTMGTHLKKCMSFRSLAGTSSTNDIFWGYYLFGGRDIGLAGGNASTYITECQATIGGPVALTDSIGIFNVEKPVDTYITRFESSNLNTTISINGDSSVSGNADIHIINPILDGYKVNGIIINNVGNYGAINIIGGYFAPAAGTSVCYGIRVQNSTGMVSATNNQVITHQNTGCYGMWIENSSGVSTKSNMILGSSRPIVLLNSSNCSLEDTINNPAQAAGQCAVWVGNGSKRNYIRPMIKGMAGAFPQGIRLVGSENAYNEINCTGVDAACITGGSANKLLINDVQITSTGLVSTNLASGIMS